MSRQLIKEKTHCSKRIRQVIDRMNWTNTSKMAPMLISMIDIGKVTSRNTPRTIPRIKGIKNRMKGTDFQRIGGMRRK